PPGPTETIFGRPDEGFGIGWRGLPSSAVCEGAACAGAGLRGCGAAEALGLTVGEDGAFFAAAGFAFDFSAALTGEGRDFRPSRCALPITALRDTPPSSSAIWLAVAPPSHILVSVAMRSSVQLIGSSAIFLLTSTRLARRSRSRYSPLHERSSHGVSCGNP